MLAYGSTAFVGYVAAYALAALGCGVALRRAVRIEDAGTRRGLVGLLVGSGGWALTELAFVVAPTPELAYAAYLVSLIVGLTAVGAWLYFCSAYTGRSFHRNPTYRRAAVGTYLGIVLIKLTNPLHGLYFTTEVVSSPFPHLTVQHGTFHWVVAGLSYALVAIGFFMLYELFLDADYDTRPLVGVVALTGLPVVFDLVGFLTPFLIDVNYEPLGVAVFAVAALYLFEDRFLAVQLTDGVDDAVIYLDRDDRIREFNQQARDLFPSLSDARQDRLATALPDVATRLDDEMSVLEHTQGSDTRYYLVNETSFSLGQTDIGRLVVLTDVTETERQRREIERHNEQLEGFAAAIRHELLNTLTIVGGNVDIAGQALDDGDIQRARDALQTSEQTVDRMVAVVEDFAQLARYGQTVQSTQRVDIREAASGAFEALDGDDLTLSVEDDAEVEADPSRLRQLFREAFEFALRNGASTVTVTTRRDGFAITDDGDPPDGADPEKFFEYGAAVPSAAAGMTLPNLRTFARIHGWDTAIDTEYEDGLRVLVTGTEIRQPVSQ